MAVSQKLNHKFAIQSFLYKSVYNEFVNTYKKDKSMMLLQMKYYESLHQEVETMNENKLEEIIKLVTNEVEKLPPKCKLVFSLSKREGLTNIEISEYLNISIKTVEAHIAKAFTILKDKLEGKMEIFLFLLFGFKQYD